MRDDDDGQAKMTAKPWKRLRSRAGRLVAAGMLAMVLAGCQEGGGIDGMFPKADRPIPPELTEKMKAKGMSAASPILVRIYKSESELEVWKATDSGRYDLLETYEICKWSGKLGPKFEEGDRQAPEGFYTVRPVQMNPKSSYYLSFNMGFPNSYDRVNGRTGTHLMVHGACSSAGCYSMTDERIAEIYALAREAFKGGQQSFQIQAFPFRMTPENMAEHKDDPNFEFWQMLKEGSDHFEITRHPPKVDVCDKRYVFNREAEEEKAFKPSAPCPETTMPDRLALAYSQKISKDEEIFAEVLKKKAIRDFFAGKKPGTAAAPEAATAAAPDASADETAEATATSEAAQADADEAQPVAVPEPSPKNMSEPPAPEPKRNWLLGLFKGKG